uniref:Uncharacterized protein n=1 Tax=Medicago truncatula TaxID=3880 RepID=Q1SKT6_MEDTR|nr:hypothetical protein MtrDRAFT_AC140551g41v2 [Medicago truncatula]
MDVTSHDMVSAGPALGIGHECDGLGPMPGLFGSTDEMGFNGEKGKGGEIF